MTSPQPPAPSPQPHRDATCLGCGCLCDDITLHVAGGQIVRAERACAIGERWFLAKRPEKQPECTIGGRVADLQSACAQAAKILGAARSPLFIGLGGLTCEAQRLAVGLADRLGACVDVGSELGAAMTAATQSVGMVTATLGEVRNRADLVIFWGADPATTHPRHFERYSLTCAGEFVPAGRADRTCVVIDHQRTPTADAADMFFKINPYANADVLEVLRLLAAGHDAPEPAGILEGTGIELARWQALMARMKSARYGSVFFDSFDKSLGAGASADTLESLFTLVREMNRHTRFVALPLGSPVNLAGAEQVLTWQTGVPSPVSFAAGYPQRDAKKHSAAAMLAAGEADAVLVLAYDSLVDPVGALSEAAAASLARIPTVVLHTAELPPPENTAVTITVATPGIDCGGTVFRCDGVPLALRPAVASLYPATETILDQLHQLLVQAIDATDGN